MTYDLGLVDLGFLLTMKPKHNFRRLQIWKEGMDIVSDTYKMVNSFPSFERFNLVSQITRCAVSIPSNIAEGTSKSSDKHFNNYLEISLGSAFEYETQLIIAYNEGYISEEKFKEVLQKIQIIQKKINTFRGTLNI